MIVAQALQIFVDELFDRVDLRLLFGSINYKYQEGNERNP